MKRLIISLFVAVLFSAFPFFLIANNMDKDSFVKENAKALMVLRDSSSICFNQYDFSLFKRVLICIHCEYAWGKGITEGGYCSVSIEEEPGDE